MAWNSVVGGRGAVVSVYWSVFFYHCKLRLLDLEPAGDVMRRLSWHSKYAQRWTAVSGSNHLNFIYYFFFRVFSTVITRYYHETTLTTAMCENNIVFSTHRMDFLFMSKSLSELYSPWCENPKFHEASLRSLWLKIWKANCKFNILFQIPFSAMNFSQWTTYNVWFHFSLNIENDFFWQNSNSTRESIIPLVIINIFHLWKLK